MSTSGFGFYTSERGPLEGLAIPDDRRPDLNKNFDILRRAPSVIAAFAEKGIKDLSEGVLKVFRSWSDNTVQLSYTGPNREYVVLENLNLDIPSASSSGTPEKAIDVAKRILDLEHSPPPRKLSAAPAPLGKSTVPPVSPSSVHPGPSGEGLTFQQLLQLLDREKADRADERAAMLQIVNQLGNLLGEAMRGVQRLPRVPLSDPSASDPIDQMHEQLEQLRTLIRTQQEEIAKLRRENEQIPQLQARIHQLELEKNQALQTVRNLEQQLLALQTANEELRGHKTRLERENGELHNTTERLQRELHTATQNLETVQQQLREANTKNQTLETRVRELLEFIQQKQTELENTKQTLDEQKVLVTRLREQLSAKDQDNNQLTQQLQAAETRIEELTSLNREQGERLVAAQTALTEKTHELDQAREENEQLKQTNRELTDQLQEKTTALTGAEKRLLDLQAQLRQAEQKLGKAESRITELEGTLEAQKARVKELLAKNHEQAAKIKELETALRAKDAELDRLRISLKEHRQVADTAKPALDKATTDLAEKDKLIRDLRKEIDQLKSTIDGLRRELSKVQQTEAGLSAQLRKAEAANESIPQLEEQLAANDSAKHELEEALRKTQDELQELRTQFNDAAAERDQLKERVAALTAELGQANNRAQDAERSLKELSEQMDALKRTQGAALRSKDEEINKLKQQLAALQAQARNPSADAATIASLQQQLKAAEEAAKKSVERLVASQEQDINKRVSNAIQAQQSRIAALEAQLTTLKAKVADSFRLTQLERTLAAKEREIDELKQKHEHELRELQTKNRSLVAENIEKTRQLSELNAELIKFEELKKTVFSLQSQRESFERKIKDLEEQLAKAQADAARLSVLEEENTSLRAELENLRLFQAQMPPAGNKDLEKRLEKLQQTIEEKDEEIAQLKAELVGKPKASASNPLQDNEETTGQLRELLAVKEAELYELDKALQESLQENSSLNGQITSLERRLEALDQAKLAAEKQLANIGKSSKLKASLAQQLKEKTEELEGLGQEIRTLQARLDNGFLSDEQRKLKAQNEVEIPGLKDTIASLKEDIEQIKKALAASEARNTKLTSAGQTSSDTISKLNEQVQENLRLSTRLSKQLEAVKLKRKAARDKAKETKAGLEDQIRKLSEKLEENEALLKRQTRKTEQQASQEQEPDDSEIEAAIEIESLKNQLRQSALLGLALQEQVESLRDQLAAKTSLEITEVSDKDVRSRSPDASSELGAGNKRDSRFVIVDDKDLEPELDEEELEQTLAKLTPEEEAAASQVDIADAYNKLARSVAELETQQNRNYQGLDQSIRQAQDTISVMRSSLKEKSSGDADAPADFND